MSNDDGTDEGPPSFRGGAGLGDLGLLGGGLGGHRGGDGGGDSGDEREGGYQGRIGVIRDKLQKIVVDGGDEGTGWGDSGSDESASGPSFRVDLDGHSIGVTDDWGDLNNPRALIAFAAQLANMTVPMGQATRMLQ